MTSRDYDEVLQAVVAQADLLAEATLDYAESVRRAGAGMQRLAHSGWRELALGMSAQSQSLLKLTAGAGRAWHTHLKEASAYQKRMEDAGRSFGEAQGKYLDALEAELQPDAERSEKAAAEELEP